MSRHHLKIKRAVWNRIRARVLEEGGYRCRKCGKAGVLEVDHILPLRDGGTHALENLQVLCRGCHIRKHHPPQPGRDAWRAAVSELLP